MRVSRLFSYRQVRAAIRRNFESRLPLLRRGSKSVVILNYHCIGRPAALRAVKETMVSASSFRRQITLLSHLGKIVSLDAIREATNLSKINFVITLDNASKATLDVIPFLESHAIPYAVCLSVNRTNSGELDETYLSWEEIKSVFADKRHVTIVANLAPNIHVDELATDEIRSVIRRTIDKVHTYLGYHPTYLAVPSGHVNQDLALDLTNILCDYGYKGILWTAGGSNIVRSHYRHQLIHLSRVNAPGELYRFAIMLVQSLFNSHHSILELINPVDRRDTYDIVASVDPGPAMRFEALIRQGKDYSSDPGYYKYFHRDNPFKNCHPDYYVLVSSGRIESIIYKLHLNFSVGSTSISGCYFSSWRKLPISNRLASGLLLLKALKGEPIVGGSSANSLARRALRSWKAIPLNSYEIQLKKHPWFEKWPQQSPVEEYNEYSERIDPLTAMLNERFFFSVERSAAFYRWRYDQYPLAKRRYFVLFTQGKATGYFVTLYNEKTLFISDFFTPLVEDFDLLLRHVWRYCLTGKIDTIQIKTTLPDISNYIENHFCANCIFHHHYYYFDPHFTQLKNEWEAIEKNWEKLEFHETQACGDVLLK